MITDRTSEVIIQSDNQLVTHDSLRSESDF